MVTLFATVLATGMGSMQVAEQEYAAYLSQYSKSEAIIGALQNTGGPVNQPSVAVFRLKRGGMYSVLRADLEEHYDGNSLYTYFPKTNKYSVGFASDWTWGALFGPGFAIGNGQAISAVAVRDEEWNGAIARMFTLRDRDHREFELFVRKDRARPLAIRYYGSQAAYTTSIVELHTDVSLPDTTFQWSPPKGAVKSD
jgi:outer membrane lipoprotein-sorting protein